MSDAEEIAKAIQASAKLGEKGIDTAQKAGGFFARVFKVPLDEMTGMVTDKLRFVRWKRLVTMSDEVDALLKERGVEDSRAVPPKLALPIMEEASLEDDPNLQFMWNHLLANAMDPQFNDELRYGFLDMIKNITGVEAKILDDFYNLLVSEKHLQPLHMLSNYSITSKQVQDTFKISASAYSVAAHNLMRLQLIAPAVMKGGVYLGPEPLTIFKGIDAITLTPLGAKFVEACLR